jgi:hypothetical protein
VTVKYGGATFVGRARLVHAMAPADFMAEIVLPTVLEFREEPRSRRRAYLACIATFHVKDHLAEAGERDVETAMRDETGIAFDVVRDVCNGAKHREATRRPRVGFLVGADSDRPPAIGGVAESGVSRGGDAEGGREIEAGGQRVDLYDTCTTVLRAYVALYPHHFTGCDLSEL